LKEIVVQTKNCSLCKGTNKVSREANYPEGKIPPGIPAGYQCVCHLCQDFREKTWRRIYKEVHTDLYA
jgi:hypothetical protein